MSHGVTEKTLISNYQNKYFLLPQDRTLVFIGAMCHICNNIVVSYDKYMISKKCLCNNEVRILGGLSNPRLYAKNTKITSFTPVYDTDAFEVIRKYATRGCLDKEKNSIEFISISTLPDETLERALISGGDAWHLKLLAKEIQFRFENKIIIENGKDRYL